MSTSPPGLSEALVKRYRIERELGAGGMATVYLAHDVRHDRKVALKVLRPELRAVLGAERFLAEIRITARLQHPHILPLLDSGAEAEFLYYVLPFVRGESLRDRLNREQHLTIDDALAITGQVAGALGHAHRQGVVHRDIKPENILLQDGEAMLADFGIALAVKEAAGTRLTGTGISLGTPQYMSPEQAAGDPHLDARSDIYSLAAVLYEMLAGEPPVNAPNAQAIVAKLMTERPTRLRVVRDTVSEAVDEAVARALSKLPADRFATATEFMAALGAPAQTSSTPAPIRSRMRWVVPIAGLAVVGAAVALWFGTGLFRPGAGAGAAAAAPTQRQITFSGDVLTAAQSPDGRSIAYVTADAAGGQLMVQDLAGGTPIRLGPAGLIRSLAWSPDGSALLVGGTIGGPVGEMGIYLFSRLGGTPRRLTTGKVSPRATWSPDGRRIAAGWGELGTITIVDVGTAVETTVNSGLDFVSGTAWSPNGRLLAFISPPAVNSNRSAVYTLDVTSRVRRIVVEDTLQLASPRWSPQSDAIYYTADGMLRRIRVSPRGTAIGSSVPLLAGLRVGNQFSLSADGRTLVHVSSVRRSNLWELAFKMGQRPEPATTRQLTSGTVLDFAPKTSPDGRWIAFIRCPMMNCDVFRIGSSGGTPEQLTFSARVVSGAAWSPVGDRLAFVVVENSRTGEGARVGVMESRGGQVHVLAASSPLIGFYSTVGWAPGPSIVYQSTSQENWASFNAIDSASENERSLLGPDAPAMREARAKDTTKTWRLFADNPHLSPNGAHLAFQRVIGLNTGEVWVVSLPGGLRIFQRAGTQFVGWDGDNALLAISDNARLVRIALGNGAVVDLAVMPPGRRCVGPSQLIRGRLICSFEDNVADAWRVENFDPALRSKRP